MKRTFSARTVFPIVLGLLVGVTALPISFASLFVVRENTGRLLSELQEGIVDGIVKRLRAHFAPVTDQMVAAQWLVENQSFDPSAEDATALSIVRALLATTPQVFSMSFQTDEGTLWRYVRGSIRLEMRPRQETPRLKATMDRAREQNEGWWGDPIYDIQRMNPMLTYIQPLKRQGQFIGVFLLAIDNEEVGEYLRRSLEDLQATPFVLIGGTSVIVHPNLGSVAPGRSTTPTIADVNDPVLAAIWTDTRFHTIQYPLKRSRSHWTYVNGAAQGYFWRELDEFGDTPWFIGYHQPEDFNATARNNVELILLVTPLLLILALLVAYFLGRLMSRNAEEIAAIAGNMEALRFDRPVPARLVHSRLTEIALTSRALENGRVVLRRFDSYVPRGLLQQLMTLGDDASKPVDTSVTLLFLDLEGYSEFSRGRTATDVAAYLNSIFSTVGPIIEAHGGTIDKYTGDGLLAVWGAPMADPSNGARTVSCAREIARIMAQKIAYERRAEPAICRIRMGLHTGRVIAGDLGYAGRTDYTVIGRTVNVTQRVQIALRGLYPEELVVVAATSDLVKAIGSDAIGSFRRLEARVDGIDLVSLLV